MDDFASADLTHANLADADLTGVRWSLSGTIWPPETDVKALLARSEEVESGGGVLVVTRRGMVWPSKWLARGCPRHAVAALNGLTSTRVDLGQGPYLCTDLCTRRLGMRLDRGDAPSRGRPGATHWARSAP
jgi:hypothetical protein